MNKIQQRITTIRNMIENDSDNTFESLSEKGIENTVIMPILENHLSYDPLKDIQYEVSAKNKTTKYDFLIRKKFLVEAKKYNRINSKSIEQIKKYIALDDKVHYGLLTDGETFDFYIQKSRIKEVKDDASFNTDDLSSVYHFLSISLLDKDFLDIIKIFEKENFENSFHAIANIIYRKYVPQKGKGFTLIKNNKKLDEKLKSLIDDTLDIVFGEYYNKEGFDVGDQLVYDSDVLDLRLKISSHGRVAINTLNTLNGLKAGELYPEVTRLMLAEDFRSKKFVCPMDIIKALKGQSRINNQEKYKFIKG